ncbi:hypothetical protein ABEY41_27375 [Peribacillus butanolivorans]|uniref:hypothetical protein n=1 Tax=Peribacillus butanolivorans TaxID=421767 RepID=UPI003D2A00C8
MTKEEKKATKRLEKEFKKLKEDIQNKAEFFTDISTKESYIWTFKIDGSIIKYSYIFSTEEVKKTFA